MTQLDPADSRAPELFALSVGVFVYRVACSHGPGLYLCRSCFEAGKNAVLDRKESVAVITHACPHCKAEFLEKKKPLTGLAMSPWG